MNEKRIYSLNLGAYLIATTNLLPTIKEDENTHTFYMLFPQCAGIAMAIDEYKNGNPQIRIKDFLRAIKQLRNSFNENGGVLNGEKRRAN